MVYSLKFDSAHCKVRRKELTVKESSDGNLIVNDKQITVFKEVEPRKIPWDSVGVNYVIEATESLQSRVNALHHLEHDTSGINTMEKLVNKKDAPAELDGDCSDAKPVISILDNHISKSNVNRVIVASNSTEFPSFGIGINDDRISKTSKVICSISAQANALVLPLKILQQHFGIKFCSYTYLKAVMGPTKEIKCPTLGPSSHKKSMRWDFSANLVPAPCPSLEEEAVRYMPSLRGRIHGMVVYTPVPEVSMFDLTIHLEKEDPDLYNSVCNLMSRCANGSLKSVLKYVKKMGDETSASGVFSGSPQSVIFDERSGCQIDRSTVKVVVWFDNEHGYANRIIDLVRKCYDVYNQ